MSSRTPSSSWTKHRLPGEATDFVASQVKAPGGKDWMTDAWEQLRTKALEDYWWFQRYCCGFEDIDNELHHEMCYVWDQRRFFPYALYLVPRKHLKTTMWTIGDSLFEAAHNVNLRQFIGSATLDISTDMLTEIKRDIIEKVDLFRWLFPELVFDLAPRRVRERCRWTQKAIDWPGRTSWKKEPSIQVTSVGHSMTSKHFDILRYDDIVDEDNSLQKDVRDGVYRWFKNTWQLRHKLGESRIRLVGTRWHFDDVYGREINAELAHRQAQRLKGMKVKPRMLIYRRQVLEQERVRTEAGIKRIGPKTPIWPERFPEEELTILKESLPRLIWSCQWENNPVSPEDAVFKLEDIRRIWDADLHNRPLVNVAAVDFALSDKHTSDPTVVTVSSFDAEGKMYVREIYRERTADLNGVLDVIFRLTKKWNLTRVVVETQAFQEALVKNYKARAVEAGVYIPWLEVKRKKAKFARWLSLQPIVQNGDFYVVHGIDNESWLFEEMTTLTIDHMPANDDILDTLSDCYMASRRASSPEVPPPAPDTAEAVFTKLFGPMFPGAEHGPRRGFIGRREMYR